MAETGAMTDEQFEFIQAVAEFQTVNSCRATHTDILAIALWLGYRKVAPKGEYKIGKPRCDRRR